MLPFGDASGVFGPTRVRPGPSAGPDRTAGAATAVTVSEDALRRRLERITGRPVDLVITRNRQVMVHVRKLRGGSNGSGAAADPLVSGSAYGVRLHAIFLEAPERVLAALCTFVRDLRRRRGPDVDVIHHYVQACEDNGRIHAISAGAPRRPLAIRTRGEHHDLDELFRDVVRRYFRGLSRDRLARVRITWGRRTARRRSHISFGSYDWKERLIRVHPILDHPRVPRYFLEFVVYHELLHAAVPVRKDGAGRRIFHSGEFRRRERDFEHYEAAIAWEKRHLPLFFRRSGLDEPGQTGSKNGRRTRRRSVA